MYVFEWVPEILNARVSYKLGGGMIVQEREAKAE